MPLFEIEKTLFSFLHGYDVEALNQMMIFFSSFIPWIPLTLILFYFVKKNQSTYNFLIIIFFFFLMLAMSDSSTSYFFKNFFSRLRPCHMDELKPMMANFGQRCGGKLGFFSSHAANSTALACYLLSFTKPNSILRILSALCVVVVCYSRIYLGSHLPFDILAGMIWGASISFWWSWLAHNSLRVRDAV